MMQGCVLLRQQSLQELKQTETLQGSACAVIRTILSQLGFTLARKSSPSWPSRFTTCRVLEQH